MVQYDRPSNKFVIQCEPQVTMRLKRVFGKMATWSQRNHLLHASEENARDLEWFTERYPLAMDDTVRQHVVRLSSGHRETERFIHDFYSDRVPVPPFDLAIPAREYQKEAAVMLHRVKGYLLGDDVGLGKTVSFITALTDPALLPAVVVTLAHLPRQWQEEIRRFAPQLTTYIPKKGTPDKNFNMPDVMILNYHKLAGWAELLSTQVRSVCFDEVQELRRSVSDKYIAAQHLAEGALYRIGLSATPIYNYGGEFFNVINILAPGKLGTAEEFYREWCNGYGDKSRIREPKAFGAYLKESGIMLRRTRSEVKREIPAVSKFHQTIDADTAALDRVSDSCAELARLILREDKQVKGDKMRASEELSNMLRQATGIAKAPYVANFVKILIENGENVVLYGWHRAVYEIWKEQLSEYNPVMYTGSETSLQKEISKQQFINGHSKVLIISLRAGAGLDGLQHACKTVVFGELDWSPGVHEQAIGRVARDGQKDPVVAYFLVAEHGSDPIVVDVLGIKKGQIEGVRNYDSPLFKKLQRGDGSHMKRLAEAFLQKRGVAV
jgi:SNF2 family DNA or RNA helicase